MPTIKRLLIAGDTHGDLKHWRYLIDMAKDNLADAIFIVGDFGYWEHFDSGVEDLDYLDRIATRADIPVYWCDGNHDKTSMAVNLYKDKRDDEGFMLVRPNVRYAERGHRWTWNGVRFIALGGAYSVDKEYRLLVERETSLKRMHLNAQRDPGNQLNEDTVGMHWFPEEEMTDQELDAILAYDSSPVDILFAHDKPISSNPGWNRKNFPECLPNQKRLQRAMFTLRPKAFIHGHLHYRYEEDQLLEDDYKVRIIGLNCNPDAQDAKVPRAIDSWMMVDLNGQLELPEA